MYEDILIDAGLTRKQAKTYLACLELGKAKIPDIAQYAGLKRTTIYGILDELAQKGFLTYIITGRAKLCVAKNPRFILESIEKAKQKFENALPRFETLFETYNIRPHIQFFEGQNGIKKMFLETLKCQTKKIFQIAKVKDFIEAVGEPFAKEYVQQRAKHGIIAHALHPKSDDVYTTTFGTESELYKRHTRYFPPDAFYASMIVIYDNKVGMASTKKENFAFIIESGEFSNSLRAYFEFLWRLGSKDPETTN